jgi:hypothetical protein
LLLGTSCALAFDTSKLGLWGSMPLDDLTPLIAKSARLQQKISDVLSEGDKKQEDVTCFGMRFSGPWKNLGGLRVSPYACDFGAMRLQPPFALLAAGAKPLRRSRLRRWTMPRTSAKQI